MKVVPSVYVWYQEEGRWPVFDCCQFMFTSLSPIMYSSTPPYTSPVRVQKGRFLLQEQRFKLSSGTQVVKKDTARRVFRGVVFFFCRTPVLMVCCSVDCRVVKGTRVLSPLGSVLYLLYCLLSTLDSMNCYCWTRIVQKILLLGKCYTCCF